MDDFNDNIDDMLGGPARPRPVQERLPDTRTNEQKAAEVIARSAGKGTVFNDKCAKCGGSGFFKGNRRFPCFACRGRGVLSFKTSPEARAKGRARAAEKRQEREMDKAQWQTDHVNEIAWAVRAANINQQRGGNFGFPQNMLDALARWGMWTDAQLAAVQKCMARDAERKTANDAKRSVAIDIGAIERAFATARERASRPGMEGVWLKPLKLRAHEMDLTFQAGSEGSQWEGMIFVKHGDKKLGSVKDGVFKKRFECTDGESLAVLLACEDPGTAARAFGKAWRTCCVCGRTLLNDGSIEAGIGPICAENFGF